jgi:hypothetical protein
MVHPQRPAARKGRQMSGRDPCPLCGIRGDLGCQHQKPSGAAAPVASGKPEGRKNASSGNGWNFHRRTLSRSARELTESRSLAGTPKP